MSVLQDPPKAIDWEYIQALYMQGVGPKEIARKTGVKADTISVKATRRGWTSTLRKTGGPRQEAIEPAQTDEQAESSSAISKASASVRKGLSDELLRAVATLSDTPPSKRLETQLRRASVMQTLAGAAKPVFGWSEGQSQPAVRISILGSAVIQEQEQPAIDVNTEPKQLSNTDGQLPPSACD